MALRDLSVRFGADTSGFDRGLKRVQGGLKSLAKTALGLVGIGLSIKTLTSSVKALNTQIVQETKLATVMRTRMGATNGLIQSVKDLTAQQQALGVVGDEVQMAGAAELATYLQRVDSLKTLIPAMNDLIVSQYGTAASAESAMNVATMMGKVMAGQTGALSRYGFQFDEAQERIFKYGSETEKAAELTRIFNVEIGQVNKALGKTPVGQWKQLTNLFGDMLEALGRIVEPLQMAILPALSSMVVYLTDIFNKTAAVVSLLMGYKSVTAEAAAGMAAGAGNANDMADGVDAAGKAAKKLAGFDVFNDITKSEGPDTGGASGTGGLGLALNVAQAEEPDISPIESAVNRIRGWFTEITQPIMTAWEFKGADVVEAVTGLFANLRTTGTLALEAVSSIWGRLAEPYAVAVLTTFESLVKVISSTTEAFNNSWLVYGKGTIDDVADALTAVWKISGDISEIIGDAWATHIPPVTQNIMEVIAGLTGTFAHLGDKLLWVWENGGKKFWTGITELIGILAELVTYVVKYVYGEFIDPMVRKLADVLAPAIAFVFDKVAELLGKLKDLVAWLLGDGKPVLDTIITILGSFALAWGIATVALGVAKAATAAWAVIAGIGTGATTAFGAAVAFLTSPFGLAVLAIGAVIAAGILLYKNWDTIKTKAGALWEGIKVAFSPLGAFFADLWDGVKIGVRNFVDFVLKSWDTVKTKAKDLWDGIKAAFAPAGTYFSNLWEGVKKGFVGFVNFIISGINTMIKGFLAPVNALISGWNSTVGRVTGQIPTITIAIPSIPALAKGGLAYGHITALVGDNFNSGQDPEVISPLSTLKNIILEALLQKDIATGDDKQIRLILTLENGETLVDMLIDPMNNKAKNLGYAPVFKPAT